MTDNITDEDRDRIRECEVMRDLAEKDKDYNARCIMGEKVWFVADVKGRMPGHIYSENGAKEFNISRCCEFHFDEMFPPDEDE